MFRGIAALAVVMHHAAMSTEDFVEPLPYYIAEILKRGYLGVDFFFVLSGFIITYAHWRDAGALASMKTYSLKRLIRIYPAYLPISIGLLLLYFLFPAFSASGGREISISSSLFLLPSATRPALSVAWTLVHEMQFYAFFLLYFFSARIFFVALFMWSVTIIASQCFFVPKGWLGYPLSPLNIEFMFGVLAASAIRLNIEFSTRYILRFGVFVAVISLFCMFFYEVSLARIAFALGLACIITGVAHIELGRSVSWPLFALLIGNASYSIYLVHNPLLSVTQRIASNLGQGWLVALIVGTFISVSVGLLYHILIERPSLRFSNMKLKTGK